MRKEHVFSDKYCNIKRWRPSKYGYWRTSTYKNEQPIYSITLPMKVKKWCDEAYSLSSKTKVEEAFGLRLINGKVHKYSRCIEDKDDVGVWYTQSCENFNTPNLFALFHCHPKYLKSLPKDHYPLSGADLNGIVDTLFLYLMCVIDKNGIHGVYWDRKVSKNFTLHTVEIKFSDDLEIYLAKSILNDICQKKECLVWWLR